MLRFLLPLAAIGAIALPIDAYAVQRVIDPGDGGGGGGGGTTPPVTTPPVVTPPVVTPPVVTAPVVTTPVVTAPAAPPTLNLSTGLNAAGTLQTTTGAADAYWTVSGNAAQVSAPGSSSYFAGWVGPDAQSSWVVVDAGTQFQKAPPYTFTRLFDLAGLNLSTTTVSGRWSGDDSLTLSLNGNVIATVVDPDYSTLHDFVAPSSDLVQGVNTLTATMDFSDQNTDGFRLEGAAIQNAAAGDAVPEPLSIALFGTGLAGMAWLRRRNA